MTPAVIVTGKHEFAYNYLKQSPAQLAYNSSAIVRNYEGAPRPNVNGFYIEVLNDTEDRAVFKVLSDCMSLDVIGEKPSADLWFFLPPNGVDMGWVVYNCDFDLHFAVDEHGEHYERNWKRITVADAGSVYNFAVSTLIDEKKPKMPKNVALCCTLV